jgi:hypothetical protein
VRSNAEETHLVIYEYKYSYSTGRRSESLLYSYSTQSHRPAQILTRKELPTASTCGPLEFRGIQYARHATRLVWAGWQASSGVELGRECRSRRRPEGYARRPRCQDAQMFIQRVLYVLHETRLIGCSVTENWRIVDLTDRLTDRQDRIHRFADPRIRSADSPIHRFTSFAASQILCVDLTDYCMCPLRALSRRNHHALNGDMNHGTSGQKKCYGSTRNHRGMTGATPPQ